MTDWLKAWSLALALFLCATPASAKSISVVILYTTDTHGHIVSDETTIGLDRVAAVKKSLPGAVLLDAGDFLHGSPLAGFDKGKTLVSLMCGAGYFAAAAGNHEFSFDLPTLRERAKEAAEHAPPMRILSSNIQTRDGPLLLEPWARRDVAGIALCVFGLTTTTTKNQSTPSTVADLTFDDPFPAATRMVKELRASGCDLVVALTHLGSDAWMPFTSLDLAAVTPGLDAIIDGHSHRQFASFAPGLAPVVSSGSHGKALGKLTLAVDAETRKILAVENAFLSPNDIERIPPDPDILAQLTALQKTVDESLSEVIVQSPAALSGDRVLTRTNETAFGDLTADALRAAYGTDIAIVNAGGIRKGLPKGPVTRKDVAAAYPFGGYAVSMEITGTELLALLEHGFGKLPEASGGFPQISGFSVVIAPTSPSGSRVANVRVGGVPLRETARYTLTTNEFLAQGGDGYPLAAKIRQQTWMRVDDAVIRYLREHGVTPLEPEGRMTIRP